MHAPTASKEVCRWQRISKSVNVVLPLVFARRQIHMLGEVKFKKVEDRDVMIFTRSSAVHVD
jgi:hypothetical protein